MHDKSSFITEARRGQIIEAAIRTLDEIGYVRASLSQIAKRAGISTALISYHFADKTDLMNHLLINLLQSSTAFIAERVGREHSPAAKLRAFIEASLEYQRVYPARSIALIEIVFNARTPGNIPYYRLNDDEDDAALALLRQILRDGQERGAFGRFHPDVMAHLIQGAVGEYMLDGKLVRNVDPDTYCGELVRLVEKAAMDTRHEP